MVVGAATLVEEREEVQAERQIGDRGDEDGVDDQRPASGTVERLAVPLGTSVEPGDLLLFLRSS